MLFGKNTLKKRRPIFKHKDTSIPVRDNKLYLGFVLDSVLNWMEHLEMVSSKIILFTCNIRKIRVRDLRVSAQFLKIWYNTADGKTNFL